MRRPVAGEESSNFVSQACLVSFHEEGVWAVRHAKSASVGVRFVPSVRSKRTASVEQVEEDVEHPRVSFEDEEPAGRKVISGPGDHLILGRGTRGLDVFPPSDKSQSHLSSLYVFIHDDRLAYGEMGGMSRARGRRD